MSVETSTTPRQVVLVIGSLQAGGAERQLSDMANYWSETGRGVTLATWSGSQTRDFYPLASGIRRVWLDNSGPHRASFATLCTTLRGWIRLRRLIRQTRPIVVLSFIDVSNIYTILSAFGLGVRIVVSERTDPRVNYGLASVWILMRKLVYRFADGVVAQTEGVASWINATFRTRAIAIPNSLRVLPNVAIKREPIILSVGRLSREKGFDVVLKAFALIREEFPAWCLIIIGSGPEKGSLLELRDELGLQHCVRFMGEVRDVEAWMARAGIFAHASRREGFPNALLEAMGMGAAVICTDCLSGPGEIIQDSINGRLVPVDDIDAFAAAMKDLLGSQKLREQLGERAQEVRNRYNRARIMRRWEDCLFSETREDVKAGAVPSRRRSWTAKMRRVLDRLWLRALFRVFRFDVWHAGAPYSCRPYKSQVVALANSLNPRFVVEIGCGLGDILRRIHAVERIGIDIDVRVIRAAKFLHPSIAWVHGDANEVSRLLPDARTIDCLIMVNWIHAINEVALEGILAPLLNKTRYLIVDSIDADGPQSYRYKHDFSFLKSVAQPVSTVRVLEEARSLVLFKVAG
jgi:GalNAc-alpha-(1->4)-GalNAc-alpha-(1->3)-diNAcBac-PP-undecaprenol alpha-1,4-N-acetyl-D-galactosaminyltransferase